MLMSFRSHDSVPIMMSGVLDSMVASSCAFLLTMDWQFMTSILRGEVRRRVWSGRLVELGPVLAVGEDDARGCPGLSGMSLSVSDCVDRLLN